MESESSGLTDDTSFTQNAERCGEAASHEETTYDQNVYHSDITNRDTVASLEEEQESGKDFESLVVTQTDNEGNEDTSEEMYFSPSHSCKDLDSVFNHKDSSLVSNQEHVELDPTEGMFRFCDVLTDEDQAVQDVRQQPEEQVPLRLSRALHHVFLSTFTTSFLSFLATWLFLLHFQHFCSSVHVAFT